MPVRQRPPAKLCPLCHRASRANQCACGYEFGQSVDKALELLADQRTNARIVLGVLLVLDVAVLAATVYLAMHGVFVGTMMAMAVLVLATIRSAHKLAITRTSIKQLEKRKLPEARLLSG